MNLQRKICWIVLLVLCGTILSCSGDSHQNTGGAGFTPKAKSKVLASDFQVTTDATDQSQPAVAYDTANHNNYLTVWVDSRNSSPQIYGAICTGSDNPGQGLPGNVTSIAKTVSDFPISSTSAAGNKTQPKVAFYHDTVTPANSKYLVVWTDSRNGYGQIYGQFVSTSGALLGGNFTISSHTASDTNQSDPDLIYNPVTGKFVVAWIDNTTFDTSLNPANVKVYTASKAVNSITVHYIPYPQVDNNMVRTAEVDPVTSLVANVKDVSELIFNGDYKDSGSAITESWTVQLNEQHPKLAFNPITGDTITAWSGTTSIVTITINYTLDTSFTPPVASYSPPVFTSVDQDGGKSKVKIRRNTGLGLVKDYSFGTQVSALALAVDPNTNRLLVAWEDNNGGSATGKNIEGQLLDITSFSSYGNQIDISTAPGDQTSPVAAFDNVNERFFVVWEDARNESANLSNIDIYGQFIDPQGNLSGGNSIVTVAPGNQLAPAVAFGDVNFRKFFVVWKDGRQLANSDIFGQLLEFSSSPQLVITDSSGNPVLNGSIDFGSVLTGQTKDITINLRNDGNSQLTINSMSTPNAPFSFQTPAPVTINPGTSYAMTIRFAPTAAGAFQGNTNINSNGGTAVLNLSGSGTGITSLTITTPSLPDASTNSPYSVALAASGGVFPYTWSATGLPPGLSINAATGVISGTPTVSGSYNVIVSVTDNNSPKTTVNQNYILKVGVVSIATTTLTSTTQGVSATPQTITATGGTAPYTFTVSSGSLPPGMTLSSGGVLSGTPTTSGSFAFTVRATDFSGQSSTQSLNLVINPSPSILATSLPVGVVGTPFQQTVTTTGGTLPNTFAITSGSLPAGLTFNPGTGTISGTPTAAGTYPITFALTDAAGAISATKTLTVQINTGLDISNPTSGAGSPPGATLNAPYSYTFLATGGVAPYSWSIVAGSQPAGLTLNPFTGILSGTPTALGNFQFIMQVADNSGTKVSKTYNINVSSVSVTTSSPLTSWTQGLSGFSQTLAATGGSGTFTWSITSGSLPSGLTLNPSTGVISGTPTSAGTSTFTVTATDTSTPPGSSSKPVTLVINQPLTINTTTLPNGTSGSLFSQQLSATDGTAPLIWTLSSGSLPAGLTLGSTGTISGVPTATGTSSFVAKVTDAAGATAIVPLSITIDQGTNGAGGSNNPAPAAGGKSGCFIATAAYGSYLHPQVYVLRQFRDQVLLTCAPGRAFVAFYYRNSPPIADFISEHDFLRMLTRWALTPLIFAVKYPIALGIIPCLALFGALRRRSRVAVGSAGTRRTC